MIARGLTITTTTFAELQGEPLGRMCPVPGTICACAQTAVRLTGSHKFCFVCLPNEHEFESSIRFVVQQSGWLRLAKPAQPISHRPRQSMSAALKSLTFTTLPKIGANPMLDRR